jgi:tetratricopeptide (TPR) repeat protein
LPDTDFEVLSDSTMSTFFKHRVPVSSGLSLAAVVVGMVAGFILAATPALVSAQPGGAAGDTLEDDPFADELNPFGPAEPRQPAPRPADPAPRPAPQPGSRLPVPFPEATVPGGAAGARPTVPDRGTWEPSPAESLLVEAEKLDQAGKLEQARAKLREAIEKDPKLPIAYLALGVVSRRLGDFEGSVDALSKGLLLDPQDSAMSLRRGIAWFHLGLYGIALEDFEEAAGIAYDDPRPELWRGLTLMELDRPLEAINAYASSIRRDRTFMLAYLNRGLAYLIAGQPSKAEFDFDQAIRHDPDDVRAWFNRGVALGRQGRFTEAVHSYEQALKRNPKHEPSRRNLAAIRNRAGR